MEIIVTENQFKNIVKTSILNEIDETTRRQKAQQAIKGVSEHILTCAILTAANPLTKNLPQKYNDRLNEKLKVYLKTGNFVWFPVKGHYDGLEKSFIVYNISLEDAIHIGEKFEQESIIWVDNRNKDISYQYWEQNGDGVFRKTHERNYFCDMKGADDFFTELSRKFNFQIPFFNGEDEEINETITAKHNKIIENAINKNIEKNNYKKEWINERILHLTDNSLSGRCKFESRGNIYGGYQKLS